MFLFWSKSVPTPYWIPLVFVLVQKCTISEVNTTCFYTGPKVCHPLSGYHLFWYWSESIPFLKCIPLVFVLVQKCVIPVVDTTCFSTGPKMCHSRSGYHLFLYWSKSVPSSLSTLIFTLVVKGSTTV